jgi:hypothetical protein
LDSREQALLVISVCTEIVRKGVMPGGFNALEKIKECEDFHEITRSPGDIVLMHPFMLHSASRNALRIPRIITDLPVLLKEPFNFDRQNPMIIVWWKGRHSRN